MRRHGENVCAEGGMRNAEKRKEKDGETEENAMSEEYAVKRPDGPVRWSVEVPGSKSMTNRALLLAALSDGSVRLDGVLFSEDTGHFLRALQDLGFPVEVREDGKQVVVRGCAGVIPEKTGEIYVGSAGTAARFLTAMLGFSDGMYTVQASEQMKRRPMGPLFELLEAAGAAVTYMEKEKCLPVCIRGRAPVKEAGPLELKLDISQSTQFLSALLLISPLAGSGLRVRITSDKADGSYIRITRKMMEDFGVFVSFDGRNYEISGRAVYHRTQYTVEPDMSAACYFYAAAAVTGGRVLVRHVHMDNTQGDLKFLGVLEQMGCTVEETGEGIVVCGPHGGTLRGLCVNMNDFSDQALTLAAIAPFADGPVRIEGIGHIRRQESDRIHAIAAELHRIGIRCDEEPEAVTIYLGAPHGGVIETYDDHRVAMAFSLTGLRADGIRIAGPECCAKTFKDYFTILDRLCGGQNLYPGKEKCNV